MKEEKQEEKKMQNELTTKTRNWFLTINQEALSFTTFIEKIKGFEKCQFSYILHDKDDFNQPHYHLCILFENARTFETMQKHFPGAHIEIMESKYKSFRYLLHLDNPEKYQYSIDEVVERGNNVEYYSKHDEYIKLDTESLLENIKNGTIKNLYDAVKLFGLKQCNFYRNMINQMLEMRGFMEDCALDYKTEYELLKVSYSTAQDLILELGDKIAVLNASLEALDKKYWAVCRELAEERGSIKC